MRMINRRLSVFRSLLLSVAAIGVFQALTIPAFSGIPKPLIPVTKDFKLSNGLRVLLSEDHSVPVSAIAIVYDVGARDERKGRSGFAHFFEHMMFQGSDNIAKMEHMKYIEGAGGSLNAQTHPDYTNFWEKVPSNQMELCLWLESDRMRSLKITPANFQNQLETVKEEKRSRIDNQAYVPSWLRLDELLFDNWANQHAVIGTFEDLNAASVDDVKEFFKTYYSPNNAVMAIVGDFDAQEMQKLVEKYFSSIPNVTLPQRPDLSEPAQNKPKAETIEDKHAQLPAVALAWKAPARREPDYYPLTITEKILSAGDSSRLYQRMIKGEQIAISADAGYDERRGPGAFQAYIIYKTGNSPEKIKEVFWSEIDKLKNTEVSATELEKARNQILRGYFAGSGGKSLQKGVGKAELLAEYTAFFGDPKCLDEDIEALMKVTPADIQRVAKKYFNKDSVTEIDVVPSSEKSKAKS